MEITGSFILGVLIGGITGYVVIVYLGWWITNPPKVTYVSPSQWIPPHQANQPICAGFDQKMDDSTINSGTVKIVACLNNQFTDVNGEVVATTNGLVFFPVGSYPMGTGITKVTVTLIGTDTGLGAIKNTFGVALDGDGDNRAGGNYEWDFLIGWA